MAEDLERYGDYNDIEYDRPPSKNPVIIILKLIIGIIILGVVGILAFRMILFNSYPDSVKNLYFDSTLTEYYNSTGGDIGAKTQSLRFPYDDPDLGNFFCDHMVVIEGADQLQVAVRYNKSTIARLNEEYSLDLSDTDPDIFTYRLTDNYGKVYDDLTLGAYETRVMYRYQKLIFNGVELSPDGEGKYPEYIRLEIFVRGIDGDKPFAMIPVYENNKDYSDFDDYKLSGGEKP